ncbi:MoaD/ThiS family protein [Flavihumibacter petaseus]|uniref:Putative molybdopterin synthase small subunit n=1 Tax=Flavihumibacter petaseus NBRC 106054 TaxID=1220578 RepID=A0A0E9N387_9BACT|nr:MoaD/ThiS family protein [Flavihumibacter petaseus]GAO44422.1 putative molybdopterin synthase small subunit [Flavihumibacter petaseus NBRC 106054]
MEPIQHTVLLFGQLAEKCGSKEIVVAADQSAAAVIEAIHEAYPVLADIPFRVAVNRKLVDIQDEIPQGAEIALLPPFSGG